MGTVYIYDIFGLAAEHTNSGTTTWLRDYIRDGSGHLIATENAALLTSATVFTAGQETENDPVRSMCFTVEVRISSSDSSQAQMLGTFSAEAWNALWDDLGVTADQWRDWQVLVQSLQQHVPIVADMPELSRLAYIDEGAVHFKAEGLRADALAALSRTTSPETRALLDSVILAAETATAQPGADVVVHPFGACGSNASDNDASHRLI